VVPLGQTKINMSTETVNLHEATLDRIRDRVQTELAGKLYTAYCKAVGGKSVTGADLPTWEALLAEAPSGWAGGAQVIAGWKAVAIEALANSAEQLRHAFLHPEGLVSHLKQGVDNTLLQAHAAAGTPEFWNERKANTHERATVKPATPAEVNTVLRGS